MKLYDFALAPNPQRVNMFIREKGINITTFEVNTREKQQFSADFQAVNPFCQVPVLELDDGTCISESTAICHYLEEIYPNPNLCGKSPIERSLVEMWSRRAEFMGYLAVADIVRNSSPIFKDRGLPGVPNGVPQIDALVDRGQKSLERFFVQFDSQLKKSTFVAGNTFSIADITTFVTIRFSGRVNIAIPSRCKNLKRWYQATLERSSAECVT